MKDKKLWFLLSILGLIIVIFYSPNASAKSYPLRDILFGVVSTPQSVTSQETNQISKEPTMTLFPEGMPNPPTQDINWVLASPEQVEKNHQVLMVASELVNKAKETYLHAGWVYVSSNAEYFILASPTLPDGSPTPSKSTTNTWSLLNEEGRIIQYVTIQDVGDERLNQIGVFKDGISRNLSLGEEYVEEQKTLEFTIDSQFIEFAEYDINICELSYSEGLLGNEKVLIFKKESKRNTPIRIGRDEQNIREMLGSISLYYFSVDTGLLLKAEAFDIRPSGEIVPASVMNVLVVELISQPPSEILDYLK